MNDYLNDISLSVVTETDQFVRLKKDWQALYQNTFAPAAALSWEWLYCWWRVYEDTYGSEPGGLAVVTVHRKDALIGALPLYLQVSAGLRLRRLLFLSTGEKPGDGPYPEGFNLLALASEVSTVATAVLGMLRRRGVFAAVRRDWHECSLTMLAASSPLLQLESSGSMKLIRNYVSPFASLEGGFEKYLSALSANSRQHYRKLLRAVDKEGLCFEVAKEVEQAAQFLDLLIRLHTKRWNKADERGAFHSARVRAFHHLLLSEWFRSDNIVLASLSDNGRPLALLYGFISGTRFEFYQSGVSEAREKIQSPGVAAHLRLMQHLAQRGVTLYDFLAGESSYKSRLATGVSHLHTVRLIRPGMRSGTQLAIEGSRWLTRKYIAPSLNRGARIRSANDTHTNA